MLPRRLMCMLFALAAPVTCFLPTPMHTRGASLHSHLPASAPRVSRNTVLSMNLFSRFGRVAKANLNQVLNKMEDPEKMMNQAVDDLQKDLVKVRQSYAEIMATQKRLEKQRDTAKKNTEEWLQRAQIALEKGEEELAREALQRKQQASDQAGSLEAQIETQSAALNSLYDSMTQLESKIAEAKSTRETYVARARTAKTATTVNDMLSGIGDNSMSTFDRMKEKVESLEAQAEVSQQLMGASTDLTLESKFKALEGSNSVDDELAKMKASLPGGQSKPKELSGEPSVDDELAKMKREMEQQ